LNGKRPGTQVVQSESAEKNIAFGSQWFSLFRFFLAFGLVFPLSRTTTIWEIRAKNYQPLFRH
jgi:hypothetical protein